MLATRLKELREERGLSQVEISDRLGIKQPTYATYERGSREPNCSTLIALASFFHVSIDYLVGKSDYRTIEDAIKDKNIGTYQKDTTTFDDVLDFFGYQTLIMIDNDPLIEYEILKDYKHFTDLYHGEYDAIQNNIKEYLDFTFDRTEKKRRNFGK